MGQRTRLLSHKPPELAGPEGGVVLTICLYPVVRILINTDCVVCGDNLRGIHQMSTWEESRKCSGILTTTTESHTLACILLMGKLRP